MNTSKIIIGLGLACAACCSLPLGWPLLAGVAGGSLLAGVDSETLACVGSAGLIAVTAFLMLRLLQTSSKRKCSKTESPCGCSGTLNVAPEIQEQDTVPIACTLSPGDFKERISWIRSLARESLITAQREPLKLHLTYDKAAASRVREMVSKEQACCAFMRFDLQESADGIDLTITAPEAARSAANDLFAHFAPELARSQTQSLSA